MKRMILLSVTAVTMASSAYAKTSAAACSEESVIKSFQKVFQAASKKNPYDFKRVIGGTFVKALSPGQSTQIAAGFESDIFTFTNDNLFAVDLYQVRADDQLDKNYYVIMAERSSCEVLVAKKIDSIPNE